MSKFRSRKVTEISCNNITIVNLGNIRIGNLRTGKFRREKNAQLYSAYVICDTSVKSAYLMHGYE